MNLRGLKKRITQSDILQTKLKVTENLELCVTNPSGRDHLVFTGKTKVVHEKMEFTLDAIVKIGEETYHVGDYIRFVWQNPFEVMGPPEYVKNEVIGKINAFYFDEGIPWVGLGIDAYHREYGAHTSFIRSKERIFLPQQIQNFPEKLTEEEYKRYLQHK